jgi:hypothetical protein
MMSAEQLEALCAWLENDSSASMCDGTLRCTEQWLTAHNLSTDVNIPLIFASCAHCDCEVVFNSRETGWPPQKELLDMVLEAYDPEDCAIVLEAYEQRSG